MTTGEKPRRYVDHYQGKRKQDRQTPRLFFDKLHTRFAFTLDGAASPETALLKRFSSSLWPVTWNGERVFCNPPWSNIPPFIELAATADLAVLLVPARTNCKWFHRALALGAKTELWQGKLNFSGKWNSPIDCLLLLWDRHPPCRHPNLDTQGATHCNQCGMDYGW